MWQEKPEPFRRIPGNPETIFWDGLGCSACLAAEGRCEIWARLLTEGNMAARFLDIKEMEDLARKAKFQPEAMAALLPCSLRQLQRFFEKKFGQTPTKWTRELRCRLARRLIEQGWSNKAVAAELNFGNESHLCHDFKRIYGAAPQTFGPRFGSRSDLSGTDDVVSRQECRS